VSINTSGNDPDASAMLDISSYEKGILIPRMNVSGRDSIANPANGLLIYNVTDDVFNYYDNGTWHELLIESEDSDQQNLSLSGDSLLISNGMGVDLESLAQSLQFIDTISCDTTLAMDQTNYNNLRNETLQWQSWTATSSGILTSIEWMHKFSRELRGGFSGGYARVYEGEGNGCLLYTSDAADDMQCVDLGGRRIIKKKKHETPNHKHHATAQQNDI